MSKLSSMRNVLLHFGSAVLLGGTIMLTSPATALANDDGTCDATGGGANYCCECFWVEGEGYRYPIDCARSYSNEWYSQCSNEEFCKGTCTIGD